ncbi:Ferric enterobactin transport system permease protein fepD [Delftia tsuruhatensis]|uniref:iron chelate uptake ABC transporter family permease subunit n=1 Tax=Delftia tsuruhatensis TaxID=180282 RepID=UPI001E763A36|nr:iron chelate uptake ABC transporter family permease subunit [Delftia tsuruhatensis]CAB5677805.1 Ferric enterobactin transport system permease protein fepD [Delftia tsuruhatensis]CAC9693024.1 Ferric enterobactin transport system permease protein fepD [Delftia tsuruhatensis]
MSSLPQTPPSFAGRPRAWGLGTRLALLGVLALLCLAAFMTVGVKTDWAFVLEHRGTKVLTMALVACAIGLSTVVFQTVSHNTILTPSVMGLDALYLFVQAALVLLLGAAGVSGMGEIGRYALNIALMMGFSVLLMRWLFVGHANSLHLMLLVGMVGGIFFRSLAGLAMRVLDPNEFTALQDRLFANFNAVNLPLLAPSLLLIVPGSAWIWCQRRVLDVISLGRDAAISLGVDYEGRVLRLLAVVACLVAVSTALVGPVVFFGLLVSNMAYHAMGTRRHAWVLPAAVLWGCVLLLGGQVLLEQLFHFNTVLSIVVEFLGGIVFIVLLMRKGTP